MGGKKVQNALGCAALLPWQTTYWIHRAHELLGSAAAHISQPMPRGAFLQLLPPYSEDCGWAILSATFEAFEDLPSQRVTLCKDLPLHRVTLCSG